MKRRLAVAVVALAGCKRPSAPPEISNGPGPGITIDAALTPSAWALRCRDALTRGRDLATQIEPKLATMPVEIVTRTDRETVDASAYPPIWKVAPIYVFAVRADVASKSKPTWETFATFELGSDHRVATRRIGDIDIAILLDGWDPQRADAIIAALEGALDPCFQR